MTEAYRILTNTAKNFKLQLEVYQDNVTRGHNLKLVNSRYHYDLRKYSFAVKVLNIWKHLPDSVISARTSNTFKNRLDSSGPTKN